MKRPAGWPSTFEIGASGIADDAKALRARAPFAFNYQYLAGGANTDQGWATWKPNGTFASMFADESTANSMMPVFTYYMARQSLPGRDIDEVDAVEKNLRNADTMKAYLLDLELLFKRVASDEPVVVHMEPDLWGFMQQKAKGNDPTKIEVQVGSTGIAELAGLPDNAAGFAQAIVKLRDAYAPNVMLAYHVSIWATGTDIARSNSSDGDIAEIGADIATFYQATGANFDLAFIDIADRDAAFKEVHYGDKGAWMDDADYERIVKLVRVFTSETALPVVIWQIPFGNKVMRSLDGSWNHYQDNKVEWFLGDKRAEHLQALVDAGVVALLFGRGADGTTCACDANHDGITNPDPIDGNNRESLSADDDGGYFMAQVTEYYAKGQLALP
ncbi:MAG: hypothetical protein AB7Q27_18360 [Acidimicrobiia bacterium]